jgi:hypothetical protein
MTSHKDEHYRLALTATERDWLLRVLEPRRDAGGDIATALYARLLDAAPFNPAILSADSPLRIRTEESPLKAEVDREANLPMPSWEKARDARVQAREASIFDVVPAAPPGAHPHKASRDQILEHAAQLIGKDRAQTYGSAADSFERIARLWSVLLGIDISATDVARLMVAMKLSRLHLHDNHADSWVDIAGYAALGAEIAEAEL